MNNHLNFEAQKIALKQDSSGFVLTLRIHPDELPEEIFRDFCGARYSVAIARINDDETLVQYRNRVQESALLCKDNLFWEFLSDQIGEEIKSEDKAVSAFYALCSITSRVELNGKPRAKEAFDQIIKEYNEYSKKKFGV